MPSQPSLSTPIRIAFYADWHNLDEELHTSVHTPTAVTVTFNLERVGALVLSSTAGTSWKHSGETWVHCTWAYGTLCVTVGRKKKLQPLGSPSPIVNCCSSIDPLCVLQATK